MANDTHTDLYLLLYYFFVYIHNYMASFSCSINHVSIFPGILRSLYVSIVWPGFAPCTARLQCRRVMFQLLFVDFIQQNMPTVLLCLVFFVVIWPVFVGSYNKFTHNHRSCFIGTGTMM